jgi:hypothetical protein
MLPIFRIIPVGGVLLAIAILLLALQPPRGATPLSSTLLAARGPLIDRDEHPELRQFLILAALDRADAVNRLRVIPETHIPPAPPARTPQVGPSLSMPPPKALSQPQAAPVVAPFPETETLPVEARTAAPTESEPKAPAVESMIAKDETASAPATASPPEATPTAAPANDERPPAAVAALPMHQAQNDESATTVGEKSESVMPTGVGEAAAFALPIVLPHERPPSLRKLDRRRAHEARSNPRHKVRPPRRKPVRRARRATQQDTTRVREIRRPDRADSFDLFTALFGPPQAAGTPGPGHR